MKVRLSTVNKGRVFSYKGTTYEMGSVVDPKEGGRFRWAKNLTTNKWVKFTVHGAAMVDLKSPAMAKSILDSARAAQRAESASSAPRRVVKRPVKKSNYNSNTRTKVAKVLVSKGDHTYRVTAVWFAAKKRQTKEFRVNANSAAEALSRVPKPANPNVRVTFTVARVSE